MTNYRDLAGEPAAVLGKQAVIAPPPADAVSLRDALDDVPAIARLLDQYDAQSAAPAFYVAASLFFKVKVRAVLGSWLTHAVLGNPVPARAEDIYIDGHDYSGVFWREEDARALSREEAADALNALAADFVAAYTEAGVAKSDAWGSTGLAAADPWMSLKKAGAQPDALIADFEDFKRLLVPDLQAVMLAIPADVKGGVHFRRRKSCCHKYELPGKDNCSTCSKVPLDEQLQALQK